MGQTDAAGFEAAAERIQAAKQYVESGDIETAKTVVLETYDARAERTRRFAPPDKALHQAVSEVVYGLESGDHDDVYDALDELYGLYAAAAERSRAGSDV
ncbi:hypothetical protein [Natronomonas sp. LN261]|jgi:hypothetical protein|uniref:hypothetical protein n=1 Tax=Natronomonas sp. LN261 TaxID=2750669 RepID=UPI0015EEDE9E|nr:hypothetical protein [Natronomonas sp. LN261]